MNIINLAGGRIQNQLAWSELALIVTTARPLVKPPRQASELRDSTTWDGRSHDPFKRPASSSPPEND
jgi:hypothetical protein